MNMKDLKKGTLKTITFELSHLLKLLFDGKNILKHRIDINFIPSAPRSKTGLSAQCEIEF
jgi:hypothetical protein